MPERVETGQPERETFAAAEVERFEALRELDRAVRDNPEELRKTTSGRADELITAVPGGWEFTAEVAEHFDEHVRRSVPLYDEIQQMVVDLSEWFIRDGSTVYDFGSSTGETIAGLLAKHTLKRNVRFVGIDNSVAMVRSAREKVTAPNADFLQQELAAMGTLDGADFVTCLFTLQFLPFPERRRLLERVHRDLSEGGALVIAEKVSAEHASLQSVWNELHWDFKQRQRLTDDMILHKARSLRGVLMPLSLSQNVELLRDVGFSEVETFVQWFSFAGIIAVKRGRTP